MAVNTVASILLEALRETLQQLCVDRKFLKRVEDPVGFQLFRARATAALFYGVLGAAVVRAGPNSACPHVASTLSVSTEWDTKTLGVHIPLHDDLESLPPRVRPIIERAWEDVNRVLGPDFSEVGHAYEEVIAADFKLVDGEVQWIVAHEGRNRQGAFFTPDELAVQCARIAIDRLIYEHVGIADLYGNIDNLTADSRQRIRSIIVKAVAADYSCGVGRFLRAYLKLACEIAHAISGIAQHTDQELRRVIACQLIGVDVDYIALEIAKLTLLADSEAFDLYAEISSNFTFGNALVHSPERATFEKARVAFQSGFLYSSDLGLNLYLDVKPAEIILGNPPWERIRLEERSFFFSLDEEIANCTNKSARRRLISGLSTSAPALYSHYCHAQGVWEQAKALISGHPYFSHSAHGELNTYALFTELALNKRDINGVVGLLVKTGLVATAANRKIFQHITSEQHLVAIGDFINTSQIFRIDNRERFCYLLLGNNETDSFLYGGLFTQAKDLSDKARYWGFPFAALDMLNPDTGMLPTLADPEELKFLLALHERNPTFRDIYPEAKFGRLVHFTNHAEDIRSTGGSGYLAVYEGKFIEQYDGRFATFDGIAEKDRHGAKASARALTDGEKNNRKIAPIARYHVSMARWNTLSGRYTSPYSLMWRSLTSPTNRRTCIATILPHQPTSQSIQFLQLKDNRQLALLLAILNSTTYDYIIRRKLSGIDLTQTVMKQTPVPHPTLFDNIVTIGGDEGTLEDHILARVCLLLADDFRLDRFCDAIRPDISMSPRNKKSLKSEIDFLIAHSYRLSVDEYERILCEFPDLSASGLETRNTLIHMFSGCSVLP